MIEETKKILLKFLTEDKWTQKAYSRDNRGNPAYPADKTAVCWCPYGALLKQFHQSDILLSDLTEFVKAFEAKYGTLEKYNDSHTHTQVMEAIKSV